MFFLLSRSPLSNMMYEPQTLFEHIFILSDYPINLERGRYSFPLVGLSYIIAVIGSYVSLELLNELWFTKDKRQKNSTHLLSALTLGVGIWSMHFVGMLAYDMDMEHSYDLRITLVSMLIAAIVAYGFIFIVRTGKRGIFTYIMSSVVLGSAICAMHYTGMAAMIMDADILYKPLRFAFSVIIAIVASLAAIQIIYHLKKYEGLHRKKWQLLAAGIMGAAICGMHYMGMYATVFLPYADCRFDTGQTYYPLAIFVAIISGAILISAIAFNIFLKEKRQEQTSSQSWNVVPLVIVVFGVLVSSFSSFAIHKYYVEQDEQRIHNLVLDTEYALEKRYEKYLQALRGGIGLFKASEGVTRQEWLDFVNAQNIDVTLPGINGIGFIEYLKADELESFLIRERANDAPDFVNHPDTAFDDKFVIKYIEPVSKNLAAVGLDIGFEANRRAAAEYSIRHAMEALTKKIELVQDNKKRAGFLLLLPLYEGEPTQLSEEERLANIQGWIYAPFIGEYFLEGLNPRELTYAVYDGTSPADENLIYKAPDFDQQSYESNLSDRSDLKIAGRDWTILWHTTRDFEYLQNESLAFINLVVGLIITALLACLTYLLSRRNHIVQTLIDERTKDLLHTTTQLEEANVELEEFAYRTSHDLRSPLVSSIALLSIAMDGLDNDNPDKTKEALGFAQSSLIKLEALVKDILTLSHAKNAQEDVQEIDIEEMVDEAISKLAFMENFDRIKVLKQINAPSILMAQKSRLTLLLENLISNAIKYQDTEKPGSFVKIDVEEEGGLVKISVEDNGLGIPKAHHDEVFTMFKRFHPKVAFGSGIGLYMMKKSAEVLGGTVSFEGTDEGSRFILIIPQNQEV